jgi:penicillin-binding protein 1C
VKTNDEVSITPERPKHAATRYVRWKFAGRAVVAGAVVVLVGVAASAAFVAWPLSARNLTPPAASGITVTDRSGAILRSARASDGSRLRWVPLDRMEPALLAAFVATEDRGFYQHHGIEWRSFARAARDNLFAGRIVSGASTISMQAGRLIGGLPRGMTGKPRQLLWALRLEAHLTKQEILEQYLNRVPLGQGAVGVESAAGLYFGASASNLSLGQAALLAGLARAPSRDNPMVSEARATARRAMALQRLAAGNYTGAADYERARNEPVRLFALRAATALMTPDTIPGAPVITLRHEPFPAPHFTSWLLATRDTADIAHAGASSNVLRTTLDLTLQQAVEGEVRHTVQQLKDQQAEHAAAVVLDNATGDVLAWVGSPDFTAPRGQVDMVVGRRQPGSALKPFAYALAFDRGLTAATVLDDISRTWQTASGPYRPRNYDRREHGPVRAREALASSYNIPAVAVADMLGVPTLLHELRAAGFASLTRSPEHYGLGLALGDGDVSLLEMANAYRALGNGGVWRPVRVDANETGRDSSVRIVSAGAAALVLDMLADPVARLPGFGETTPFDFAFPAAVKTGTSRHFTDNWAVAVTGNFTVAVWVGNFDGHPMAAVSGVSGAGPLLRHVVLRMAAHIAPGVLVSLASVGATRERVCRISGQRAIPECPAIDEWFLPGTHAPTGENWYREGALVLPARYAAWRKRTREHVGDGDSVAATGGDNDRVGTSGAVQQSATANRAFAAVTHPLVIESPRDGDRYALPLGPEAAVATISFRAAGRDAAHALAWSVDGAPYSRARWLLQPGTHVIAVRSATGARAEAHIIVE